MAATPGAAGWSRRRIATLVAAVGMMASAALALQGFFVANYPAAARGRVFCDFTEFLNCSAFAVSGAAVIAGVPIAWLGLLLAGVFALGALFPSPALARTLRPLALANAGAVIALLAYAVLALGVLPPLTLLYAVLSVPLAMLLLQGREPGWRALRPAPLHLAVVLPVALLGAGGVATHHEVVRDAHGSALAARTVNRFFSLPQVALPSELSPYWTVRSTARFEDAPIRIVEYVDPLCSDCQVMYAQLKALEPEFAGKLNVAFQFFPLEAACNDVVEKDLHPGACDLSYLMAYDAAKFRAIHDEVFDNMRAAKQPEWRAALARRYDVEAALTDSAVQQRVRRLVATGREYERTSERHPHGIRSTPTLIVNNRMLIGTLPLEDLRAIFRALVDAHELEHGTFLENWLDSGCSIGEDGGPPRPCGATLPGK